MRKTKKNDLVRGSEPDFKCWEKDWESRWQEKDLYKTRILDEDEKRKKYILVEFPYPSGSGLHVGHAFTMTGADVYARKVRMMGEKVLFPMGWDAFGLPTENYAIKTGQKPQEVTRKNTDNFRKQMKKMAFSFDWSKEINTTDPNYYHWTQWIFIQLFKKGLAYKQAMPINWCPSCKIGLANEEVVQGRCERCGAQVFRRKLNQWIVRITDYADRLIDGLNETDFVEKVKLAQINWIGKSEGARINFKIIGPSESISGLPVSQARGDEKKEISKRGGVVKNNTGLGEIGIFTTRPDTLWGATFMVVAPEHPLIAFLLKLKFKDLKTETKLIEKYIEETKKKSDLERTDLAKEKTGVFTGIYAINPANNKKIPVWMSDFVLEGYGTGAIMAVPAHDERDWQFAQKFNLPIIPVIEPKEGWNFDKMAYVKTKQGRMINSGFINGLFPEQAAEKMFVWLEEKGIGKRTNNYHLRDWIFSRQHYWGEPIPMIYCQRCARNCNFQARERSLKSNLLQKENDKNQDLKKQQRRKAELERLKKYAKKEEIDIKALISNPGWFPVSEEKLPVKLPQVENYQPTDTGESPLAIMKNWGKTKCPLCGSEAKKETDTMPNWAGSDWYYLAYCFSDKLNKLKTKKQKLKNNNIFEQNKNILKQWLPVDVYIGGDEHNTLHLLYSRFIYQFLYDLGVVPKRHPEPYYRRFSHGVILGSDGQKMSKSQGNVVNPDDKWQKWGVDTLRTYLMFMGPFEATMAWNENALKGIARFLVRFKNLIEDQTKSNKETSKEGKRLLNKLIFKVSRDIDDFGYNTAIAAMMEALNSLNDNKVALGREELRSLIKLIAPFAPYLAEELWCRSLGETFSVHEQNWPKAQREYLETEKNTIIVQVNGRLKGKVDIEREISIDKDRVVLLVKENANVKKCLLGKEVKKTIFVPGKLVNFVV